MDQKLRRPWFRFSLKAMFVVIALAAVSFAWMSYCRRWIEQRHTILNDHHVSQVWYWGNAYGSDRRDAPASLRPLGEIGRSALQRLQTCPVTLDELKQLFPEADVINFDQRWPRDAMPRGSAASSLNKPPLKRTRTASPNAMSGRSAFEHVPIQGLID